MDKLLNTKLNDILRMHAIEGEYEFSWASASQESLCDLTSAVAMGSWKQISNQVIENENMDSPVEWATYLAKKLYEDNEINSLVSHIEVAKPGHINVILNNKYWLEMLRMWHDNQNDIEKILDGRKIMVEFGHPNTHKEMHVGHLRTLINGESLARLAKHLGAEVLRANYQGDIGPHVAKAIYGILKLFNERGLTLDECDSWNLVDKAKLLGEAYVKGNQDYESNKQEIDDINQMLYRKEEGLIDLYSKTRQWSLDYFDSIYQTMGTKYDKFYFETDVAKEGKQIVLQNEGSIFDNDKGTKIFRGEKYGLHTRVFITSQNTPTYEAKELALAIKQFEDFKFDLNIHVVANEQAEYFRVVFKALELVNKEIAQREKHLSMGMVNLVGMKISSRTGVIITVNQIIDLVKNAVRESWNRVEKELNEEVVEILALGALKFAMLKQSSHMNIAFDIKKSVELLGFTGPYIQYTHARCMSVLAKTNEMSSKVLMENEELSSEEKSLLFGLVQFENSLINSWESLSLHHLCEYLHDLCQRFNVMYNNLPILDAEVNKKQLRLALCNECAKRLKIGLGLLGIESPNRL